MEIERVIDETPTVRTLLFQDDIMEGALPGQFAMVWVPGAGELPMSVMAAEEPGMAAFTVRRRGAASTGLYDTAKGGLIGVRGPYGRAFEATQGRALLVGGGTGMSPLMRLLSRLGSASHVDVLIGAQTEKEVFFEGLAGRLAGDVPHRIVVTTEDGSYGRQGRVTDELEGMLDEKPDAVYTCGPEPMMHAVVRAADSRGIPVQASVERVMKCGVGICGSCCMGEDLVCTDGAVFDGKHLIANSEFGSVFRDKSGTVRNV
ncbi:2-polyprenylphenol hydroxylase [Cenarchaeum symbiosum A]|uniref:2-polyprenylphenol hydroxylase n=1 Tax=Cenarchaeum symbiosum (strain A) TaxID=414004 RepID=A0RV21_CENSY|nr:2-polyprenylphenol hydroxylase [Cenarchaeum symbiosum A]